MKNFKKINLFVAALATAGALAPVTAFADEAPAAPAATQNTTDTEIHGYTKISFSPDDKTGILTLNQVPNFDFGSTKLAQSYSDMSAKGATIKVTDLTGKNQGYKVTAKAGSLKNGSAVLPVADLLITTDNGKETASQGQITGTGATSVYSTDQKKVA